MIEALLILILLLVTLYFVVSPFFQEAGTNKINPPAIQDGSSVKQRRFLEENLTELEYDFQAGKLPAEDYQAQSEEFHKQLDQLKQQKKYGKEEKIPQKENRARQSGKKKKQKSRRGKGRK